MKYLYLLLISLVFGLTACGSSEPATDQERVSAVLRGIAFDGSQCDAAYAKALESLNQARMGKPIYEVHEAIKKESETLGYHVVRLSEYQTDIDQIAHADARQGLTEGLEKLVSANMLRFEMMTATLNMLADRTPETTAEMKTAGAALAETEPQVLAAMLFFVGAKQSLGMPLELAEFQ